ncbi:MAG: ethanolamine permease [Cytophagaceae bacterium]|nr:ethanolamine permease [Cytophagaceae bacterium]
MPPSDPHLKRVITTPQLWGITVGLVISGEYFGWNYGWHTSGTVAFLGSTLLVTALYVSFIFSYTELTAAIPSAGGAFSYARRAFGPTGGFVAGFATLVDFLMAPPAIAYALGSYTHFLNPALPVVPVAVGCYGVFIALNWFGIKGSARFSLWVTVLSVLELLVFMVLVVPHFSVERVLAHNPAQVSAGAVFAGIPYAMWFFVAIEGAAMVAEEVRNPERTIPRGYVSAILTLVFLALGVMILSAGVGDWRQLSQIDYPLPEALAMALGRESAWSKVFASLGLFGLIASFHCNTISYSRQLYALAREGYLPGTLATLHPRYHTPQRALLAGGVAGLLAIFSGTTQAIIVLSVLGAVVMYGISMASLLVLRRREPDLPRPFRAPLYPWLPGLALVLSVVCMVAIIYYNPGVSGLFFGGLILGLGLFLTVGYRYVKEAVQPPT